MNIHEKILGSSLQYYLPVTYYHSKKGPRYTSWYSLQTQKLPVMKLKYVRATEIPYQCNENRSQKRELEYKENRMNASTIEEAKKAR